MPYLIREGVNGLTYPRGSYRAFEAQVLDLINTVLHLGWMMEFIGR